MATVKIGQRKKEKLERFLASHLLERGKKVSMKKALGMMIDHALECDEFDMEFEELPPLEEDPAWIALHNPKDWGVKDASEKIDEYLYGGK